MNSTPSVGTRLGEDGNQYVLIRQSASDGQYTVDICMTMEQFSSLMAVLRGLEMYFMDTELKKSVNNFPGDNDLMSTTTLMSMQQSCEVESYNPENPAYTTNNLSTLPQRPTELTLNGTKKKRTRKRKDNRITNEEGNGHVI